MMRLIRNANLYDPTPQGVLDLLIVGNKIAAVGTQMEAPIGLGPIPELDVQGAIVAPGLIDYHTHFLGGGGGSGFASRVPSIPMTQFAQAGITTAVGCLGFDIVSRDPRALLAHAYALQQDGMTTFVLSGGTARHPVPTLTGSIGTDVAYVEKVIGVGEVSLSDAGPSLDATSDEAAAYVARLAVEAMLAARLAEKAGLVVLQVPWVRSGLEPLRDVVRRTGLSPARFVPSHANYHNDYLDQVVSFAKEGSVADVTTSYSPDAAHPNSIEPAEALVRIVEAGVPVERITVTSDGNGAYPQLGDDGRPTSSFYMSVATLWAALRRAVRDHNVPLETALAFATSNPARLWRMDGKGELRVGSDADLIVLSENLEIQTVLAQGRDLVRDGAPVHWGTWDNLHAPEGNPTTKKGERAE